MPLAIVKHERVPVDALQSECQKAFGLHGQKVAEILAQREITALSEMENSAKFLLHYDGLTGIDAALAVLVPAVTEQKRVVIIGDFDADGATSTALCMLALRAMGLAHVQYLVPNRFDFGYGLSEQIVDVAQREFQAEVIVTVDNGIACHAGVAHAKALGMQVVITDHHLPGQHLPPADAIVNPNQHTCDFASKNAAGVGVAFYVLSALRAALAKAGWFSESRPMPNLAEFLDIVAGGTGADVVKLDHNNRIFVHQGLQRIRKGVARPGILALFEVAGKKHANVTATDLGFVIGPRLNAAGRLDDMSLGIECLLSDDPQRARDIAFALDKKNVERRNIESDMREQAESTLAQITLDDSVLPLGLVLYDPHFHQGVIGILAGRIKEQHYRPTIAFAQADDSELKGSARSIPGVHIRDVLDEVNTQFPGLIIKFGGHAMAAGLSLQPTALDVFTQAFNQVLERHMQGLPQEAQIISDGALPESCLTLEFAYLLQTLGPWGQGFTEPVFDNVMRIVQQRIVGEKHLKLVLQHGSTTIDAIAFGVDLALWPNPNVEYVHVAYSLNINEFRGQQSVQCMIKGLSADLPRV